MDDLIGKHIRTRHTVWTILERFDDESLLIENAKGVQAFVPLTTVEKWIEQYGVEK